MADRCSVCVSLGLRIHGDHQPPAPHMVTDEGHKCMPDFFFYIKRHEVCGRTGCLRLARTWADGALPL